MIATDLFARMAAGDDTAMNECARRFGALLWTLARRFSNSEPDAEDAVQEILFLLWQSASRFDGTMGSETTFVATIARRRLIDRRRYHDRRIKPTPLAEYDTHNHLPEPALPEPHAAARNLHRLSPRQQQAIRLSVMGLTHPQIAAATDAPLGTVKTNIRRGLMHLRTLATRDTRSSAQASISSRSAQSSRSPHNPAHDHDSTAQRATRTNDAALRL